MNRWQWIAACGILVVSSSGCSMCATPFDETYSAYGGVWERTDPYYGRVGSAFTPVGQQVTDGQLEETETPMPDQDQQPPRRLLDVDYRDGDGPPRPNWKRSLRVEPPGAMRLVEPRADSDA